MDCCCSSCAASLIALVIIYKALDYLVRRYYVGNLASRYILVTGCDTGFGHEISKRLDKMGCNVFAGCLTEKGEEELRKSCSSRLKTVRLNVAEHSSVEKAFDQVKKALPSGRGLWGVINNAGIAGAKLGPVEWLIIKDYVDMMAVNLYGVVDVTVTFLPLIKKECGRIVNTASVFGRYSLVGNAPYSIAKYGVEAFSDSIRRQLKPFKVSVHLIEPGYHKTNIVNPAAIARSVDAAWQQAPQEIKEEYGKEYMEISRDIIGVETLQKIASDRISDVVDAYENALLAVYPRARYVVGKDAKYVWLPLQWLPEWLGDWLILHMDKNVPVPAACKK